MAVEVIPVGDDADSSLHTSPHPLLSSPSQGGSSLGSQHHVALLEAATITAFNPPHCLPTYCYKL